MSAHTSPRTLRILGSLLSVMTLFVVGCGSGPIAAAEGRTFERATPRQLQEPDVSLSPKVTVHNATPAQLDRLTLAFERFTDAGLELPPLEIRFPASKDGCDGAHGRFTTSTDPWRISICPTELETVYEHELAHAWERATLSDAQRQDFMEMRGYDVWNDKSLPWRERGMEGVAVIIQQGINGLPLPPALSDEHMSRLASFQLLTGFPDPRLAERAHAHVDDPRRLDGWMS